MAAVADSDNTGSTWSLARELVPAVENGRGPVASLSRGIVRALKRK